MKQTIIIGTRGSQLALWQAEYVRKCLNDRFAERSIELKIIKTTGDKIRDRSLVGLGKGVFTKEIEIALLNGTIDLAVHSMKDLPTDLPDGLCIAAIPVREDPRDVLVAQSGLILEQLPKGAKIGTTSPRRKSQLLHLRPDLQIVDVRGNLDTRLRKLNETDLDGIILAAAGIKRLIGEEIITEYFEVDRMVPPAGQGALGVEAREDDLEIKTLLDTVNDVHSETEVLAERAVLGELGGGCQVPIGVNAQLKNDKLHLIATVCSPDGKHRILERLSSCFESPDKSGFSERNRSDRGDPVSAQESGINLAKKLIQSGAHKLQRETCWSGTGRSKTDYAQRN